MDQLEGMSVLIVPTWGVWVFVTYIIANIVIDLVALYRMRAKGV